MLVYDNRSWLRILLQVEGGVLWRTLPRGIFVGAATLGFACWIRFFDDSFWKPTISNTWAAKIFGTAISFAIVYRTRISWARYWEAASDVHFMFSKWSDAFIQLISFIATAEKRLKKLPPDDKTTSLLREFRAFRHRLAHDFSLLSALATHRLTHGDLGRMKRRSDSYSGRHCVTARTLCKLWRHWDDLIVSKELLRYRDRDEMDCMPIFKVMELHGDKVSVSSPAKVKSMASFTSSMSDLELRFPSDLVILGKVSKEETSELDGVLNPTVGSSEQVQPDRVNMVMGWINEDINELVPIVGIPPPIMSRCYQELSNGMLGCTQATKMADIPFPFPFLQLMELLLICYTCLVPIYAANFTGGVFSSPFLATIVTMAFWSLSEISRELETPFAFGPNQLPVVEFHERFVDSIKMQFLACRPLFADNGQSTEGGEASPDKPGGDPEAETKKGQ